LPSASTTAGGEGQPGPHRDLRGIAVVLFAVAVAGGEEGAGNRVVSLDGRLSPRTLPRRELAPVAVELAGRLRTADGALPPRVTRL
jgi:hypothetical protein